MLTLVAPAVLSACAAAPNPTPSPVATPITQTRTGPGPMSIDDHVPDFAQRGYELFARNDAIAIALREWRAFGMPVDDDDPEARPVPSSPLFKPERLPGLWERIGEYWWIGQDPGEREASWTGKHDADGSAFDFTSDSHFAWSAAFISYVMRTAGAGPRFPYSPNHATYINAAASGESPILHALSPSAYAPLPGDLICAGRGSGKRVRFQMLPTSYGFPAHCALVVARQAGQLSVIGGNVDDAVTLTHVPVGPDGKLAGPDGTVLDQRYAWLTVLQVVYDTDSEPGE
jgi:hypothetical protein